MQTESAGELTPFCWLFIVLNADQTRVFNKVIAIDLPEKTLTTETEGIWMQI
jgi:hypothetical protein